ncbi:hypothetical protein Q4Q34_07145 [Flavivirga abyssicola]|uniref:hypothetical protein n=1 Tax=Flavivirga abyssicola TaxID=3063533 RepID=UPI0026E08E19|nr:hypothetical protein [Flavivirga sp. MEBiC07777]WVK14804.1 hypothetical protein Q4Q34_07145 [Flavivirga sp. MEBiC07777]
MKKKILEIIMSFIGRNRTSLVIKLIARINNFFYKSFHNLNWNVSQNSELNTFCVCLNYFRKNNLIVFDVGSNEGQWVKTVYENLLSGNFLAVKITERELIQNLSKNKINK